MSDIRIPLHIASRIERRWAEKIDQDQSRRRQLEFKDVIDDRQNRAIPVVRRRASIARN